MRILIFSDSRWRDSFGHASLAKYLDKYFVHIVSFDIWQQAVQLFKPHVVVLNHLHGKRNNMIADHIKRQGGLVVILPTEGRPNSKDIDDWFHQQLDNPNLDLFCAWNNLIKHPKIIVTGCPRFDIYQGNLIESKDIFNAKYGLHYKKKTIGITSSFPQGKFSYKGIRFNKNDWKDLGINSISGREDPIEYAKKEMNYLNQFKLWIRLMVSEFSDYQYILKPHPMEDIMMWESFCDEVGIRLIRQEYIHNFLNAIDLLIARVGCITVQEAWMLELPVLQVELIDNIVGAAEEASRFDLVATSFNLFLRQMASMDTFTGDWSYNFKVAKEALAFRKKYLDKYGYTVKDASFNTAIAITNLIQEKQPKLVAEPTLQESSELNRIIQEHSQKNFYPDLNSMHLGKSVTQDIVHEWMDRV